VRLTAAAAFPAWLAQFEGNCPWPYLDAEGLVTVGLGFLCPLNMALLLNWLLPSGASASAADVHAAYDVLSGLPKGRGGGWYEGRVGITLSPRSWNVLYEHKISGFEAALRAARHVGPAWDSLPSVCQLARLRTDWADGGESAWPRLDAALARGDWATAAKECWPRDAGPDPEDSATADRTTVQPRAYIASYRAVRALYRLAADYPSDELPEPLPDGADQAA